MKKIVVLALAAVLAGCSATPYNKGFGDSQLSPTRFRINTLVNGFSARDRAEDIAMLRASEIACLKQYRFFDVVEKNGLADGNLTRTFMTIELKSDQGEYDAAFIMDSMKKKLDSAKTKCSF